MSTRFEMTPRRWWGGRADGPAAQGFVLKRVQKAAVVGGGLAGLAAALDLVEAGHEVTVLEARPSLGGAVQTLPAREGDPDPPPDNGQHIALGCCTEYLAFLAAIGQEGSVRREPLALPVIAEDGGIARLAPGALGLLRYRHVSWRDRVAIARVARRLGRLDPEAHDGETFADAPEAPGSVPEGDRALLGRLHPTGAERPLRGGERRAGALHRADRAAGRATRRAT